MDEDKIISILIDIKEELFDMGALNKGEYKAVTKFIGFLIKNGERVRDATRKEGK